MGFENKKKLIFTKGNYKSRCAYMLMLIKLKNPKAWGSFKKEFAGITDEKSFEFFEKLTAFYKGGVKSLKKKVKPISSRKKTLKSKSNKKVSDDEKAA